jgi:hypothetical protein
MKPSNEQQNTTKVNRDAANLALLQGCAQACIDLQLELIWAQADMIVASQAAKFAQDTMMSYVKTTQMKPIRVVNESTETAITTITAPKKEFLLHTATGPLNLFAEWWDVYTSMKHAMEMATTCWEQIQDYINLIIEMIANLMQKKEEIAVEKTISAALLKMVSIRTRSYVLANIKEYIPSKIQGIDYFKVDLSSSFHISNPEYIIQRIDTWKKDMQTIWKIGQEKMEYFMVDTKGWVEVKENVKSIIGSVASLSEKLGASHPYTQIDIAFRFSFPTSTIQPSSTAIAFVKKVSPPIVETIEALKELSKDIGSIPEHLSALATALHRLPIPEKAAPGSQTNENKLQSSHEK